MQSVTSCSEDTIFSVMSWCEWPVVFPEDKHRLEDPVVASKIGVVSVLLVEVNVAFFALVLLDAGGICDPNE